MTLLLLTHFVMIVLVQLPSECARILYHFSLTKMYRQRRRVVYQNPFAYDLTLLFITSIGLRLRKLDQSPNI